MDQANTGTAPAGARQDTTTSAPEPEPMPSSAPPASTSLLSDAPTTDPADAADPQTSPPADNGAGWPPSEAAADTKTTDPAAERHADRTATVTTSNPEGWGAAKEQMMMSTVVADSVPTQTPTGDAPPAKRGGRGGKRASLGDGNPTPNKSEGDASQATPASSGRGRGRGGRPRGRGRGAGRGGKRKREDGSDSESSDSEVASPVVTMTKSGRNIQKPTSFVPPPPSPTTTTKRKRPYRRNPESAVCKMCLRGTSPASNMIVFCDGCNTPYHRYCHQPPIDQAVIDEVDKEWYCMPCEKERIVPVPEGDVASFVSAPSAPAEQRQKYFASLAPGMLVTLLTRATTLKPDLPLFGPDFEARASASGDAGGTNPPAPTNGHSTALPQPKIPQPAPPRQYPPTVAANQTQSYAEDLRYPVPDEHPAHYVRPGQGLMRNLPPEQQDVHYLVDGDKYQAFSHYHLDPQASVGGGLSSGQGMAQGQGHVARMGAGPGNGMGAAAGMSAGQAGPGA